MSGSTPHRTSGDPAIAFTRQGVGRPLLLLQGLSGHHRSWGDRFLADLTREHEVIAVDHRGIGASGRAEAAFSLADLAADAVRVLDSAGWESAHVLGVSMGGAVAQELAIARPERLSSLILGCTTARFDDRLARDSILPSVLADLASAPDQALRVSWEANVRPELVDDSDAFESFARDAEAAKVPGPVVALQAQALRRHDATDRLPSLSVPTMVLHGTADRVIPYWAGQELTATITGSRLAAYDGAGHLFWREEPTRSAQLVSSFTASWH